MIVSDLLEFVAIVAQNPERFKRKYKRGKSKFDWSAMLVEFPYLPIHVVKDICHVCQYYEDKGELKQYATKK